MEAIIANIIGGVISGVIVLFIEYMLFQPKKQSLNHPQSNETKPRFNLSTSTASSNKSPVLAAVLSLFLFGGAGHIYLGQSKKGLTLMIVTIGTFGGFGFIPVLCMIDAYKLAKRLNTGEYIREWEFDLSFSTIFLVVVVTEGVVWLLSNMSG